MTQIAAEGNPGSGTNDIVVRFGRAMRRVDVTPELARQWLDTLPAGERQPDAWRVKRYVTAMRGGTWRLMELPVVIRNGRLLSSRHRLTAVVEADMTVPMYISDDSCPR